MKRRTAARALSAESPDGTSRDRDDLLALHVAHVQDYAIFMLDPDGRVTTWNTGAQRVKGFSSEEIVGRHFSVFYPPEDVAAGKPDQELGLAATTGHLEDEGWRVRRDGTRFWANVIITALRDSDGTLRGYGKVVRDLTVRRAGELDVRSREELFRRFFDEAQIGMLIVALDGRLERANDAFAAILGYDSGALIGKQRGSITHPDDRAAESALGRAMIAGGESYKTYEKRFMHTAGHAVWTSVHLNLIHDAEARPSHYIAQIQDITERRSYERQLEYLADHDPLTGLLNRRAFQRELHGHMTRVARYGAKGAVLMIDLDNFKYYNDTQGHSAGDQLIVRIARGLKSRIRDSDVLARVGGDECAVLLVEGDERGTTSAAEALLEIVRTEAMPAIISGNKRVTASIGIARFDDGRNLSPEDIMVNADLAMYDAKEAGGDRWARYRTSRRERPAIESRLKWAEQINGALASDGFELHAEPIVRLTGGEATQFELLLRMRDGEGGLIPPGAFLDAAERLGLMPDIDLWVAGRAIDMLAEQRALGRDLLFNVNLSGRTLGDDRLIELLQRRLGDTGVRAHQLVFEITETSAIANITEAVCFVKRLSSIGCRLAIDDFGSGFGSFYYLKHLPFDYLKIDGEFVKNCAENATDRFVISAIVQIARNMGKTTIGEFVASPQTANALRELGVDYGQGFSLGRPAPLAEHLAAPAPPGRDPS